MSGQLTIPHRDLNRTPLIHGAVHLQDCPEDELPLTESELFCQFGSPVVVEGIDVSAVMRQYLAEVSGQEVKDGILPDLKTLASGKRRLEWLFGFRLLIEFDRQSHKKAGAPNFKNWVAREAGRACSGSAIARGKAHARVALVFAAAGLADAIPSQNAAMILQRHLPRKHWVDFWRQLSTYAGSRISADKVEKVLQGYAELNDVRLLKPVAESPEPKQRELLDEQTESAEVQNVVNITRGLDQIRKVLQEDCDIDPRAAKALFRHLTVACQALPDSLPGKQAKKVAECIRNEVPALADRLLAGLLHPLVRSVGMKKPKSKKRTKMKKRPRSPQPTLPRRPG